MEPMFIYAPNLSELLGTYNKFYKLGYRRLPIFNPMRLSDGRYVDILFPEHLVN